MNESKASTTQTAQSGSQLQEFRRRYACNCLYLSLSVPATENPREIPCKHWDRGGFLILDALLRVPGYTRAAVSRLFEPRAPSAAPARPRHLEKRKSG